MSPRVVLPNTTQQAEFERQFDVLINEHLSYTCIVTWVRFASISPAVPASISQMVTS